MPAPLRTFCIVALALTLCSLAYTFGMTYIFHMKYPYGLPFFQSSAKFWDFEIFAHRFTMFRQPGFWNATDYAFTYPAPAAIVFAALFSLPGDAAVNYLILLSIAIVAFAFWLGRQLAQSGLSPATAALFVTILIGTNWGIGYLMNRANIEGVVAIVVAAGILCFLSERYLAAGVLFGLAGALKIFPLIYLGLLLSRKRYRDFAVGLVAAVLVYVASLQLIGPTIQIAQRNIAFGLEFFQDQWAAAFMSTEIGYDHSLFSVAKFGFAGLLRLGLIHGMNPHGLLDQLSGWVKFRPALFIYTLITAVTGICLYFVRIRQMPALNQILILALCSVLLPPVSFDYTLVHLLLPFALLSVYVVRTAAEGKDVKGVVPIFSLFAFIFSMNAFFTLKIRLAGQFRSLAMLILLIELLRHPLSEVFGSQHQSLEVRDTLPRPSRSRARLPTFTAASLLVSEPPVNP